ncbi:MAG: serine/threonine-protein kinase [Bryobacteraceae bacterium]
MDRIGRYRIVRELGHGAMGVVYHAIDPNIGRPVAVKTIRLSEVGNAQERARLQERLFREARAAGILSHPGIVTIYDVDKQGDLAYIAMEFVDGPTLDEALSGRRPLAPTQMFSIMGQAAVALDYAHQRGIVHRDIKPANIMIDAAGSAKITDFGIAKAAASEQFTMTGAIVGTPHYMSPEQVQGHPVDGRADQFSLAVIAYEMLTGEKPFAGEQLTTVVYKIVAEEPAPVTRLNATLTPQIEAVLRKALAKKPELRYRTCQEFINALEAACSSARGWKPAFRGAAASAPTAVEEPRPKAMPEPHRRRAATTTAEDRPRRKTRVAPLFFAVIVAAGLVGLIAWQATPYLTRKNQEAQPAPPPAAVQEEKKPSPMGSPVVQKPPEPVAPVETKPAVEEPKPRPEPAPEPEREPEPAPRPKPAAVRTPARPAPVAVVTNPPGATASLDGRADTECKTPCTLQALPGRHSVSITMPGFMVERREIEVAGGAYELPLITLRGTGGTLMLTTVPPGAAVTINGKPYSQLTPAQISLGAGVYTVTVEKDGHRATDRVEIRSGGTTYRKILLQQ